MAAVKTLEKDFTIRFLAEDSTGKELRSAFRKELDWIVVSPGQNALWYSVLIGNLHRGAAFPESPTMESVRQSISKGIERSAFDRLQRLMQASRQDLVDVVDIPARTLARREIFRPDESERIIRVAAAFQRAIEVFEDLDKARQWFSTAKRALGGQTPLQFCDTEIGADEVMNLLGRMEQGVFS